MDLERAKQVCRGFPGATQDIKWTNVLAFCVGGRMFALCGAEAHSTRGMSFKVDAERFLELTDRPGIRPAPYLARAKWVYIASPDALDDGEMAALLHRSYSLIFARLTKKLQRDIGESAT
ncbi:MmcQ/YjbR family DNA-binding protein [Janthinobacterium violaceinigrum]|uniref:MmcQ/YjbR family DNA-binding protein n=1 Tax=Janthinobacterium violaceinigrum TaxID=2654252 RepID=A0A6I1I747_9BURK|nr:MmcQ/YjbR family DNA-binding protein [Janthinobacterium violaceinigrum]KAB8065850.1 MmcQ/YjbR family DNA-binding protein [Janthinobacterium violaceinigrum]